MTKTTLKTIIIFIFHTANFVIIVFIYTKVAEILTSILNQISSKSVSNSPGENFVKKYHNFSTVVLFNFNRYST